MPPSFREGLPSGDELHIFIERTPGQAIECPSCGCRRDACDTRPGEWRHLDIWQHEMTVHCDAACVDCPECGAGTARVPWASDDAARGFRNIEYFKTIIYLKLGKLPLVEATCATH